MQLTFDTSGLDALRERLAEARAALPDLLLQAVHDAGAWVAQELSSASPVGRDEGPPPPGDAPGRLAESFYVQEEGSKFAGGAAVTVRTRQPVKLRYVTTGTGLYGPRGQRIYPLTKRALYWPGARHPVRSVAGQKANDFVTPALGSAPDAQEALSVVVQQLAAILEV